MVRFDPLRSLTCRPARSLAIRTWIVVRLACGRPNALSMRPAAHREGVTAAQNLCSYRVWRARSQARSGARAGLDAMA